jgi:hypothetical protein
VTYLQQVGRSQRRSRRPLVIALAIAAALIVIGGGVVALTLTIGHKPAPAAAGTSAPPAGSSPSASAFSYGSPQAACRSIDALVKAGDLGDVERLRAFADAAADSTDTGVATRARLLRQMADVAIAAHGQADEASAAAKTRTYAVDLQKACITAGYA